MDRSKLLGTLFTNKAAVYSPDDERCHTATVNKFQWSILKDLKKNLKFMKALEKDPVENESELSSTLHSNFVCSDKDFSGLTEYVMSKPFTSEIGNIAIAGVKGNAPPKKAIEKLNAACYNVVSLTSIIKGNEGIISLLEEVNKEISEVAHD